VHTLTALQTTPAIRWIVLAVRAEERSLAVHLLKRYQITKAMPPCRGGTCRADSVARAFAALPRAARWVLVHDGARPCVSRRLITQAVRAGKRFGAVACGLPASLTVKAVDDRSTVRLTLDRDQLWFVQTPQVFRRDWLAQALAQADHGLERFPDDAAIVESAGFSVRMISGDPLNIKVTTQEDRLLAEAILTRNENRHRLRHSSV
jgi:2-C-methyl-D-erythritol 4-phosphate cytidylyltransferase